MNYKQQQVRWQLANGRRVVETRIGDGPWITVAIRERDDTAKAIADGLRELLDQHTDDKAIAAEREARESETPDIKLPPSRPPSVFHRPLGP